MQLRSLRLRGAKGLAQGLPTSKVGHYFLSLPQTHTALREGSHSQSLGGSTGISPQAGTGSQQPGPSSPGPGAQSAAMWPSARCGLTRLAAHTAQPIPAASGRSVARAHGTWWTREQSLTRRPGAPESNRVLAGPRGSRTLARSTAALMFTVFISKMGAVQLSSQGLCVKQRTATRRLALSRAARMTASWNRYNEERAVGKERCARSSSKGVLPSCAV